MQEEYDKMYQEYLLAHLDLIFNSEQAKNHPNKLRLSLYKKRCPKGPELIHNKSAFDRMYNLNYHFKGIPETFYEAKKFREGFAVVEDAFDINDYMFINTKGEKLTNKKFKYANSFHEGYAIVSESYYYDFNFIDRNGDFLFPKPLEYEHVYDFHEGYSLVYFKNKYNFIDKKNNLLLSEWIDGSCEVNYFHDGYAKVKDGNEYYFIDTKGNKIYPGNNYEICSEVCDGILLIKDKKLGYNYMTPSGKVINNIWFDQAYTFNGSYAKVQKDNLWNIIDTKGHLISKWLLREPKIKKESNNITIINKIPFCPFPSLHNYQVKKKIINYECTSPSDTFKINYKPIKMFDERFVLCHDKDNIWLFDRVKESYKKLGLIKDIEYDDNFIFDYANDNIYLMYENQMIDITDYYNKNLYEKHEISIQPGVKKILSKDDYFIKYENEIKNKWKKIRNQKVEYEQQQEKDNKIEELLERKRQDKIKKDKIKVRRRDIIENIKSQFVELKELEAVDDEDEKPDFDDILVNVGDYKEINPIYLKLEILKYINLKNVSFENVKISGIDFRGCVFRLNPQEVYKKDLRGCNFEGIFIDPFIDFSGVDIRGAIFSSDNNFKTLDLGNGTFKLAIYDKTTTYNGVPLTEIYGKCENNNTKKLKIDTNR